MRVVFADKMTCQFETLQRLVLIADEIGFLDRPSVTFGNWGFVGMESPFRRMDRTGLPIEISVHAPPAGPADEFQLACISADLNNPAFVSAFIDGFARDDAFADLFLQLKANYGAGVGADIRAALLSDPDLRQARFDGEVEGKALFQVDTPDHRVNTMRSLLLDASVRVSGALIVSEETGLVPVSENPFFSRLLAIRTSGSGYVGVTPSNAPLLGLTIARSVISDEALRKLELKDLFEYRRGSRDAYKSWSTEINRLAARISDVPPEKAEQEATRMINLEVAPRLVEYRNEMKAARDRLFGDLVKKVVKWEVPTLSLAYLANISVGGALAAVATALTPAIPDIVDYFVKRTDVSRRNAMAYLIGVSPEVNGDR